MSSATIDSSSWEAYGKIDPELEAMLPHMPPSKPFHEYGDDVSALRENFNNAIAEGVKAGIFPMPDLTGIRKEEIQIPARDGFSIRALAYRPEGKEFGPLFIYYHGGGWISGPAEMFEGRLQTFAVEFGFTVVSVDYRMAPEHRFPVPVYDCIDSAKWAAQNASKLGADPSKGFIVGGVSAGANLAAVVSQQYNEQKILPPITGAWLNVPVTLDPSNVPEEYKPHYHSRLDFTDTPILTTKSMIYFTEHYQPDVKSPLYSPMFATSLKDVPPTYFQICGMDPLRDEGLIYEHVLRESGGKTKLNVYPGIPHAGIDFLPMLAQSKKGTQDLKENFKWLLSQT